MKNYISTKEQRMFFSLVFAGLSANLNSAQASRQDEVCPGNSFDMKDYNVIYILADDLGYGDLGCYGQTMFETPNIDSLASRGILFTHHYAGSPVSAPSRCSLMTGLHTGHTYIRGNIGGVGHGPREGQQPIPEGTYTMAKMFRDAGYKTGAFGKWGLGYPGSEGDPVNQGFDEFYGYNCQALAHKYYQEYIWHNREKVTMPGNDLVNKAIYVPDTIHAKALEFIKDNSKGKFFAFLPYILPHAELVPPEDDLMRKYRGKFEEVPHVRKKGMGDYTPEGRSRHRYSSQPEPYAAFAATVGRLDRYVGEVVQLVEELGIADKTLIVFTSDNGPHREGGANPDYFNSNGPFRGYKKDVFEGGIRMPFIAVCPGKIAPGSTSDHVCTFWDMLPTFAEITSSVIPMQTDGISFMPELLGFKNEKFHETLYWEFHEQGGKQAAIWGNWKGIRLNAGDPASPIQLYDIEKDPHEDSDVAASNPDVVKRMDQIMKESHTPSELFPTLDTFK